MSVAIVPVSGTYDGHFAFAVVGGAAKPSKLKVTVWEKHREPCVHTMLDSWTAGDKLALPPGDYRVRAELLMPRLDGSGLLLDAAESHYAVVWASRSASASPAPSFLGSLREAASAHDRCAPVGGHAVHKELLARASPREGSSECGAATPWVPHMRTPSPSESRPFQDVASERASSKGPGDESVCVRGPTPAQALFAFSGQPSWRATPLAAAGAEEKQSSPPHSVTGVASSRVWKMASSRGGTPAPTPYGVPSRFSSVSPTPSRETPGGLRDANAPVPSTTVKASRGFIGPGSSAGVANPHLPSGRSRPIFLLPPPNVIRADAPFSFALAFGPPNAKLPTNSVFLNLLIEEEGLTGSLPPEPVIFVLPSVVAAVPMGAKGIVSQWVCSPLVRMDERRGVMELLGGVARVLCSAMSISTACVGPACNGLALSGIQFLLDAVVEAGAWQFFVSFREIEGADDEEEEEEDNGSPISCEGRRVRTRGVDERALGAEMLYNSLPYICCFANEHGQMALEVHCKNVVVASVPVQIGSRVAMYFGTATSNGQRELDYPQPYLSILVDYRTVFCHVIRGTSVPEALHAIIMSNVVSEKLDQEASVILRDVELLSQQRQQVAFVDEVIIDKNKNRTPSKEDQWQSGGESGTERPACVSVWVAGENPGIHARQRVTLV